MMRFPTRVTMNTSDTNARLCFSEYSCRNTLDCLWQELFQTKTDHMLHSNCLLGLTRQGSSHIHSSGLSQYTHHAAIIARLTAGAWARSHTRVNFIGVIVNAFLFHPNHLTPLLGSKHRLSHYDLPHTPGRRLQQPLETKSWPD